MRVLYTYAQRDRSIALFLASLLLSCVLTTKVRAQTETVLYTFTGSSDGGVPYAGLISDKEGNLYGTSHFAGIQDSGTVYELKRTATGWQEITLYEFQGGDDGAHPSGPLTTDGKCNLYGTTDDAGAGRCGVVFKLAYSHGAWVDSTLYSFNCGPDGANPWGSVNFD
jgi:hypothetical protein